MSRRKKIIIWISVCMLWNLSVIIPHIIMRSHLEFPTLNFDFCGWLIPIYMTVPFHGLFFGIISVYRKRFMKIFAVMYTTVGVFCYIIFLAFMTMGFTQWEPVWYPLVSETDNAGDYLIIDNETEYETIYKMFPQKIPESADDIRYKYRYEPIELDYEVNAQWRLSRTDYDSEKARVKQNAGECREEDEKTVFKLWWTSEAPSVPGINYSAEVEFYDEPQTVIYHLCKNTITS